MHHQKSTKPGHPKPKSLPTPTASTFQHRFSRLNVGHGFNSLCRFTGWTILVSQGLSFHTYSGNNKQPTLNNRESLQTNTVMSPGNQPYKCPYPSSNCTMNSLEWSTANANHLHTSITPLNTKVKGFC